MSRAHIIPTLLFLLVLTLGFTSALSDTVSLDDYTIDFEYDEEDAEAGETFRVEATITNEAGETRSDIELELDLKDPFSRDGDDEKSVGTLDDGESKTVSFRIEIDDDADEDDYSIDFEIRDNDSDEEDEFTVEVISNNADLILGSITSLPTIIAPDTEDVQLTITIENIGEGDAEAIRVKLNLPEGITSSGSYTDIANLGTIPAGDSKEVDFFIDTSEFLKSGNYDASLTVNYESDDNKKSDRINVDIPIKGRPQFQIQNVIIQPKVLSAGDDATVRVQIQNVGEETGEETSIRIFENSDIPLSFNEKTNFIGDIEQGNVGSGVISFSVDGDARVNSYLVKMQVRTVTEGNVIVEEFTITIPVNEERSFDFRIVIFIVVILIIALIIFFVYRALRRK